MIQFTTNSIVLAGTELTLNYLSHQSERATTSKRQKALWDKYRFICNCSICLDFEQDGVISGLVCLCPSHGCKGEARSYPNKDDSCEESLSYFTDRYYQCIECGHDDFDKQSRWQESIISKTSSLVDGRR